MSCPGGCILIADARKHHPVGASYSQSYPFVYLCFIAVECRHWHWVPCQCGSFENDWSLMLMWLSCATDQSTDAAPCHCRCNTVMLALLLTLQMSIVTAQVGGWLTLQMPIATAPVGCVCLLSAKWTGCDIKMKLGFHLQSSFRYLY